MKKVRVKTVGAALILLASSVLLALHPIYAAESVTLGFTSGDNGDTTVATILTGSSIGIKETRPSGYASDNIEPFTVVSASGDLRDEIKDSVTIPAPYNTIKVAENFVPQTGTGTGAIAGHDTYHITGNYYALLATGEAVERSTYGGTWGTTISSETENAITQYSACTIKCIQAETSTSPPRFVIAGGVNDPDAGTEGNVTDPTGVFANYNGAEIIVESVTKDITKAKELRFYIGKDNSKINFVMYPKSTYDYYTTNMNTQEDTGTPDFRYGLADGDTSLTKPVTKKPADNYIRKGTTFELIFRMPKSNTLFLNVMTPQYAMELIEGQINDSDGERETSFISLASGDSLNYITNNFNLRARSHQFNADFRVQWEWTPDENQTFEGNPVTLSSLDEGTRKLFTGAVQITSANQDWEETVITPQEDNITGTLTAKVIYDKSGGTSIPSTTTPLVSKKLTVRGTGKPVGVTQYSQTENGVTSYFGIGEQESSTLPGRKKMDAYRGNIASFERDPEGPYKYVLRLNMGAKNGAAKYAIVKASGDTSAIALQTQQTGDAQPVDYVSGQQISNPRFGQTESSESGTVDLTILAQRLPVDKTTATVKLDITFYVPDRNGVPQESQIDATITLDMVDNNPSQDSKLSSLTIRDQAGNIIDFPFSSTTYTYQGVSGTIHLPYASKQISLQPVLNDIRGAETPIAITLYDASGKVLNDTQANPIKVKSGENSAMIAFDDVDKLTTAYLLVPSQDPRAEYYSTYKLDIVRDRPSEDATLKSLGIYYDTDTKMTGNLVPNFSPDVLEYNVEIPFSTSKLRVLAQKNDDNAVGPTISPELSTSGPFDTNKQWLDNLPDRFKQLPSSANGVLDVTFTVMSELYSADGSAAAGDAGTRTYTVHIHRADPSTDASLKALKVTDTDDKALTIQPTFKTDVGSYTMDIPYATSKIRLNLTPTDGNASNIQVYSRAVATDNLLLDLSEGDFKAGAQTPSVSILDETDAALNNLGYHSIIVVVTAEDGTTQQQYEVQVRRARPSTETSLKSLAIKDQDGTAVKNFAFHPDETSYTLSVPYETTGVSFTPTATDTTSTIRIEEEGNLTQAYLPYKVASGATSKIFKLKGAGESKTFGVVVTAQDGTTQKTYQITITRGMPSSDARLKGLSVQNASDFTPVFVANKLEYSATVKDNAQGVIITATANHSAATIMVNGTLVDSGKASDLIELIDVNQKVNIVVTAQDGTTQLTYSINFTNPNLVEKTSNADLKSLVVKDGVMTPSFKAAATEYSVATTEDTYSVDILPQTADPLATMRVLNGSKEIGDYNGNYSQTLVDGENDITVEVTSPDKTVKKTYTVTIYRNEEDQLKTLTPLHAEDIDFKNSDDIIIVMIDQYPRVAADVFTELKNYPEKTIIFQGNDYSLEFKASDLTRVIPQTEIYDFRMSFTSPDEAAASTLINQYATNADLTDHTVYVYFNHHGSLPGPATFRLSLGAKYASQALYWHYFNQDRNRIDYYGAVNSNAKGTIALTLDHFSTYILTQYHSIDGAENKVGLSAGTSLESGSKANPNTGKGGSGR